MNHLKDRMNKNKNYGICGALVLKNDYLNNIQCLGGYTFSKFSGRGYPILPILSEMPSNSWVEEKIDYICGACMFVKESL